MLSDDNVRGPPLAGLEKKSSKVKLEAFHNTMVWDVKYYPHGTPTAFKLLQEGDLLRVTVGGQMIKEMKVSTPFLTFAILLTQPVP